MQTLVWLHVFRFKVIHFGAVCFSTSFVNLRWPHVFKHQISVKILILYSNKYCILNSRSLLPAAVVSSNDQCGNWSHHTITVVHKSNDRSWRKTEFYEPGDWCLNGLRDGEIDCTQNVVLSGPRELCCAMEKYFVCQVKGNVSNNFFRYIE